MLKSRIRKAAAAASPVKASGVAATSVWPIAPGFVKAAWKMSLYAVSALCRVENSSPPAAMNAKTIEPAGTANSSQRGCFSRRSIRMRIMASRHRQPDLFDVRPRAIGDRDDRALIHHGDPIGERQD